MNKTMLRGKFRKTRGGAMAEWGRLTENDRLFFEGKVDQMVGVFQERYGYTRERAAAMLEHYLGMHQMKAPPQPTVLRTGKVAILSAFGLAMVGSIGWFIFSKFFAEEQPPIFDEAEDNTDEWAFDEFEPEDFEGVLADFETVLD